MTSEATRSRKAGEPQAPALAGRARPPRAVVPSHWPNAAHSRIVRADGVAFHVQEMGSGPPILLVHGTGASTHSFAALMPLLAAHAHVVAIDLPGHGFSETSRSDVFTLPAMAHALGALLKTLAFEPQIAIGHSAGAAILIRLALDGLIAPQAIIALNGAILPMHPFSHPFVSLMAKFLAANPFVPWFFAKQASRGTVDRLLDDTGSQVPQQSRACYGELLQSRRHVAAALRMMAHWDLETLARDLPQLKTKLILVTGDNDRTIPPNTSDAVARILGTSERVKLPRLGHLAHEEDARRIAEIILALLPAHQMKEHTP